MKNQQQQGVGVSAGDDGGIMQALGAIAQTLSKIDNRVTHMESVVATRAPSNAEAPPIPVKRGPGRPRKHPLPLPAPVEVAPPKLLDIQEKIQIALTKESLDVTKLARAIGETVEKTSGTLKVLRSEDKVYNVGYEDSAIWTWKVGDDVDTGTLMQVVLRLVSERPMWTRDLVRATGAKESRVSGVLVEIQRTHRVEDLSGGGHAKKYFVIGSHSKDASLPPKKFRGQEIRHGVRRAGK